MAWCPCLVMDGGIKDLMFTVFAPCLGEGFEFDIGWVRRVDSFFGTEL